MTSFDQHQHDLSETTSNSSSSELLNEELVSLAASHLLLGRYRHIFKDSYLPLGHLRHRELGLLRHRYYINQALERSFGPWRSWTGASKDILSVAWGGNLRFAVGASTDHVDRQDLPYNKDNNLLLGTIDGYSSALEQLRGHHVPRPPNEETHNSLANTLSPELHMTVSHVTFANRHDLLYSASYDRTVRIWDVSNKSAHGESSTCLHVLAHDAKIDILGQMLSRSVEEPRILATAQQSRTAPISMFAIEDGDGGASSQIQNMDLLASERAAKFNIYPSAMEWGPDPDTRQYLLTGFAEHGEGHRSDREGDVCLWNVVDPTDTIALRSSDDNVFDVAWAPGRKIVAAASTTRHNYLTHRKLTRSVIRTWSPDESLSRVRELECPAIDINDILFHRTDDNIITASCTDGRIYVWDARMEHRILMALEHDEPIDQPAIELDRIEEEDAGVRFTTWSNDGRFLYSGSTDGRVACWNILLSPEDALVQEVARFDSGVMAGAFSPDGSKLLLGTVKGSVEILSLGASQEGEEEAETYVAATERYGEFDVIPSGKAGGDHSTSTEGIDAARNMVANGEIVLDQEYGYGRGPNYRGPWDMALRVDKDNRCPPETYMDGKCAAQQFDRAVRRDGVNRGGVTTDASVRARREARSMQKERRAQLKRAKHVSVVPQAGYAPASAYCGEERTPSPPCSISSLEPPSRSPTSSPSPEVSTRHPASVKEDPDWAPPPVRSEASRPSVEHFKRQRPNDSGIQLPERKRSREATPLSRQSNATSTKLRSIIDSAEIVDVDSYVFRNPPPDSRASSYKPPYAPSALFPQPSNTTRAPPTVGGSSALATVDLSGSPQTPHSSGPTITGQEPSTPSGRIAVRESQLDGISPAVTPRRSGQNGFIVPAMLVSASDQDRATAVQAKLNDKGVR